jgi:nicotinate-nucleotide adenylyltransferase
MHPVQNRSNIPLENKVMNIGIIGGAFDPVTKGHIELAKFALSKGGFDEIWLMPCYKHMYDKSMVSAEHRLEMCHLAVQQYPKISVSNYEIEHKMEMSTHDVITNLLKEVWSKYYKFKIVIGLDNANNFEKWINWESLEKLINFTVIARKGVNRDVTKTWYLTGEHCYLAEDNEIPNTASSRVRELFKEHHASGYSDHGYYEAILEQIPHSVYLYIIKNKLYK